MAMRLKTPILSLQNVKILPAKTQAIGQLSGQT
jgi:hypothetical protein